MTRLIEIDPRGDDNYFYGVDSLARPSDISWFATKGEAIWDAENADQKYMPMELVRMKRTDIERSGLFYDLVGNDVGWSKGA